MKKLIVIAIAVIITTGCTSARVSRSLSSGAIGCPPAEIQITNETATRSVHNFTASCRGKSYQCTYVHPAPIQCTEMSD
jgi:hypothetical protein